MAADVRRHDQSGVFEVHRPALPVGQAAIVEDLQHHIEDVRMRLFDFVEQNHRVGFAANGFSQLAAFFKAHISRRRAEQTRDGVLLLILGHIDANHVVFVVE